jgi:hypothetical protein
MGISLTALGAMMYLFDWGMEHSRALVIVPSCLLFIPVLCGFFGAVGSFSEGNLAASMEAELPKSVKTSAVKQHTQTKTSTLYIARWITHELNIFLRHHRFNR